MVHSRKRVSDVAENRPWGFITYTPKNGIAQIFDELAT